MFAHREEHCRIPDVLHELPLITVDIVLYTPRPSSYPEASKVTEKAGGRSYNEVSIYYVIVDI